MMKKFDLNATCTMSDLITIAANLFLIADRYKHRATLAGAYRKRWDDLSDYYVKEANVIENTIHELFRVDMDDLHNAVNDRFAYLKNEEITESPF